jgi:type IV secretion system protein VirD4
MTILIICIVIIIILCFTPKAEQPTHTYKAEFGDASIHLSSYNHGFAITGDKALTREASHMNVAMFGGTGSGKSSSVIFCSAVSLARRKSSIVFFDVSGEIWQHTAHYLQDNGYAVLKLNFADPEYSETFNCLTHCHSISDIQKMAQLIIRNANGESRGDIFWENSSIMIISLFARHLLFHAEPQYQNLQNVLRLIEKFATDTTQVIDKMIVKTKDEDLLASYKATLAMSDKTLQSVIASVRAAMTLFSDPAVCRTTSTNSIDFNMLREKPVALYCCTPLKDLMYFKPLSALFFQALFNFVLSRIPDKRERSIFFVMDEFASMKFSAISTIISNVRKYSCGILLCMQDEQALIAQYGQAEAHQIKSNCITQVYLKGQPLSTCQQLSQILGKYTYTDEKQIQRTRELMTPDEIRMSEHGIVLINNQPPLKCPITPYYKNIWLSYRLQKTEFMPPRKQVSDPPLIPFK